MNADVASGWENFFVAEAGASAALAGLVFVAVSINLTRILAYPHLPGRAAEALTVLLSVLVIATWGLVPNQSALCLGLEWLGTGLTVIVMTTAIQWGARKHQHPKSRPLWRVATNQLPASMFALGGVFLLVGCKTGLCWLVAGTLLSFVGGVLNAWVLLVEIQR
jgi:hypothetical protein